MVLSSVVAKFTPELMKSGDDPCDLFASDTPKIPFVEKINPKVMLVKVCNTMARRQAAKPGGVLQRRLLGLISRELLRANVDAVGFPFWLYLKVGGNKLPAAPYLREGARYPLALAAALSSLAIATPQCTVDANGWAGVKDTPRARVWLKAYTVLLSLLYVLIFQDHQDHMYALLAPQLSGNPERFLTRRVAVLWETIAQRCNNPP